MYTGIQTQKKLITLFWPYVSEKVAARVGDVLSSRWVGQGPLVDKVEEIFSAQFKVPNAVSVNSCTSALHLSLILAGVGEGDEVITTALTCYATVVPILFLKAKPVFADIKKTTLNIDPQSIASKITPKTKAIIVVHWGGEPCDMKEIQALARQHKIPVIEDAAHALGATYNGQPIGSLSDFTCFSFQAIKQITTGDGGMLTTPHLDQAKKAKLLRWYGVDRDFVGDIYDKFQVTELGYKYNMTDLCASILMAQLEDFDVVQDRRNKIVDRYQKELKDVPGVRLLERQSDRQSGNWLFTMLVENRKDFQRKMAERGIETSQVHIRCDVYPILGGKRQDLPVMNELEFQYVCLPLHFHLTDEDIEHIISSVKEGW